MIIQVSGAAVGSYGVREASEEATSWFLYFQKDVVLAELQDDELSVLPKS